MCKYNRGRSEPQLSWYKIVRNTYNENKPLPVVVVFPLVLCWLFFFRLNITLLLLYVYPISAYTYRQLGLHAKKMKAFSLDVLLPASHTLLNLVVSHKEYCQIYGAVTQFQNDYILLETISFELPVLRIKLKLLNWNMWSRIIISSF